MFELGARLVKQSGAALLIDYGHAVTGFGDTLQALRAHRYVDPLAAPGDCDLTAHVDFAAMARSASADRALRSTARSTRAISCARSASTSEPRRSSIEPGPSGRRRLQHARNRLVGKAKGEMGALFKAMAVADRKAAAPPGFQPSAAKPA